MGLIDLLQAALKAKQSPFGAAVTAMNAHFGLLIGNPPAGTLDPTDWPPLGITGSTTNVVTHQPLPPPPPCPQPPGVKCPPGYYWSPSDCGCAKIPTQF